MTRTLFWAIAGLLLGLIRLAAAEDATLFAAQVRSYTKKIAAHESRVPGTDTHDAALDGLMALVESIDGVEVWIDEFDAVVPRYDEATLEFAGATHSIHPVWPAFTRMNVTPGEGIEGHLVYVREGRPSQIPPARLHGNIAVMEVTGGKNWTVVADYGARAILLLGSSEETVFHLHEHIVTMPVDMPRFYVPDGELASRLRQETETTETPVRVRCRGSWETIRARNIYAAVAGRTDGKALLVGVPADSMSTIPTFAPGADAAVDAALGVAVLRDLAINPPLRPVTVGFFDVWGIYHRGTREALATLALTNETRESLIAEEEERLANARRLLEAASPALESVAESEAASRFETEADLLVSQIDTQLEPMRLEYFLAGEVEREAIGVQVRELSRQRNGLLAMRRRVLAGEPLESNARERAESIWADVRKRLEREADESRRWLIRERNRERIRAEMAAFLGSETSSGSPIGFFLGLDLSDAGIRCGPSFTGAMLRATEMTNTTEIRTWLRETEGTAGTSIWTRDQRAAVNLEPILSTEDPMSFQLGAVANPTAPAMSFGVPALSWTTLSGYRLKVDTGRDRPENLDWNRLDPQIVATRALIRRLADRDDFAYPEAAQLPRWRRVTGLVVDQAPGEPLARLPMEGYVSSLMVGTAGLGRSNPQAWWGDAAGMRRQEMALADSTGRFSFEYMPGHIFPAMATHHIQAYKLNAEGEIVRAVDLQRAGKGVNLNIDLTARNPSPLRAQVFTCQHANVFGLTDPRFMMHLPNALLLDARRDSVPRRLNYAMTRGVASLQMEPRSRFTLAGQMGSDNRLALLNIPAESDDLSVREAMRGFAVDERMPRNTWTQSAIDFHRLNEKRLSAYRRAGITSESIESLERASSSALDDALASYEANDGKAYFAATTAALANEVRAYNAVRDLANDVVRGAIFLLLMLVPFAFAMERLLIATPRIYRQIGASLLIFLLMAAILWISHPAFRISTQPAIIVIAFAIILMSLMVMGIVFQRFESELAALRGNRAESSAAKTSRGGLIGTAVRLGIATMRRRPLRTTLTASTVILITFTLLCFSSTSGFRGQRENALDTHSPYTGVLVRQPGIRAIQIQALDTVRDLVGEDYNQAVRAWRFSPWDAQWRLHVEKPGTSQRLSLPAALGLTPGEDCFTAVAEVLPDWERFASGKGCYLSQKAAGEVDLQPGDQVVFLGRSLEVIGLFDSGTFNERVIDMDGESILPLDYHALGDDERQRLVSGDWSMEVLAQDIQSGEGLEPLANVPHLDSASVIVVPAEMLNGALGDEPFSIRGIAIETADADAARNLAQRLVERLAFPVYYGSQDRVHVIATTPILPRPPKEALVPLILAGLIVFNTMLSSIAERKGEIAIYSSLGLAPVHIAFLFLAEAATYGLMGSVFGVVAGQWFAAGMSKLGLLGGITLNYSGTQAVVTILMVLAVILVSALVPAFLAGKLATPSNKMTWSVPEPVEGRIRDSLPFTATPDTAPGILAYLREYFDAHREGAIGSFTTDRISVGGDGGETLEGTVWLSPYDLGVRQEFRIAFAPIGEDTGVYGVEIELRRGSGPVGSWRHLNRVFLGDLRRQLLGWRNLDLDRMLAYIERGRSA